MDTHTLWDILALSALGVILFCPIISRGDLRDPDESRYAEIPREMMERGDYITPTLDYVPYFEKPPLQYWATIFSYKIFGVTASAARIWPGLAAIAGMLLTYWFMKETCGRRAGLMSAVAQATCVGYFVLGNVLTLDMLLTTLISGSLAAFYLGQRPSKRQRRRVWYSLFWVVAALAVLCKGLVGIVLPLLVILSWAILTRRWVWLKGRDFWLPAPAFLCIVAPWFVFISARYPSFVHFFFIHEHLERFLTNVHGRWKPTWFFFVLAAGGLIPWTMIFVAAFWRAVRDIFHKGPAHRSWVVFVVMWFAVPLLFFSASHSKLIPYILPILVPSCMLVGRGLAVPAHRLANGTLRWAFVAVFLLMLMGPAVGSYVAPNYIALRKLAVPSVIILWLGSTISFFLAAAFCRPGFELRALASAGFGAVTQCLCLLAALAILPRNSMATAIRHVPEGELRAADTLVACGGYDAGLNFYTQRRVATVGLHSELSFGSQYADRKWFLDGEGFDSLWRGQERVIGIGAKRRFLKMIPRDASDRLVWSDGERWVMSNAAEAPAH